jgi:hypothetical protein
MRKVLIAAALAVAALGFAGTANADPGHGHHGRGHRNYGNGLHDIVPHWHKTLTPYGPTYWYGMHLPHSHRVSTSGGVRL